MSSPVVLTAVTMPLEVAKARNREDAEEYLTLAEELAARLTTRAIRLQEQGITAPLSSRHPETVRDIVKHALLKGSGWEGVELAHAYWQSLKHEIGDVLDRLEAEILVAQEAQAEIGRQAEAARLQKISRPGNVDYVPSETQFLETGSGRAATDHFEDRIGKIHRAAAKLGIDCSADIEEILQRAAEDTQRLAALDVLCSAVEERAVRDIRQRAYDRVHAERLEDERRIATKRLMTIRESADSLSLIDRTQVLEAVEQCEDEIQLRTTGEAIDKAVLAVRTLLAEAQARKSLYDTLAGELRRQGYEEINEMQTLSAAQIKTRYYASPHDPERFVEIGVGDAGNSVSAEIVRIEQDTSSEAKLADADAQRKLCTMVDAAIRQGSSLGRIAEISRLAPGEPLRLVPQLLEKNDVQERVNRTVTRMKEAYQ